MSTSRGRCRPVRLQSGQPWPGGLSVTSTVPAALSMESPPRPAAGGDGLRDRPFGRPVQARGPWLDLSGRPHRLVFARLGDEEVPVRRGRSQDQGDQVGYGFVMFVGIIEDPDDVVVPRAVVVVSTVPSSLPGSTRASASTAQQGTCGGYIRPAAARARMSSALRLAEGPATTTKNLIRPLTKINSPASFRVRSAAFSPNPPTSSASGLTAR